MDWATVLGRLANLGAPVFGEIVGGLVGGPAGAALGTQAGKLVANKLGVPPTPEAVAEVIDKNPVAATAAAIAVERENGEELRAMQAEFEAVQNARQYNLELMREGSITHWGPIILSFVVMIGFCILSYLAIYRPIAVDKDVLFYLFGLWSAGFNIVLQYWFGSSSGSKRAGDAVRAIATTAANRVRA